ncbi:MAG: YheU family protein [Cellvibrionaceae bacterium]|nr:YheU family protein [Cellvibrionaceae bacterium]
MVIPPQRLTSEVLRNLLESFIIREGTDYGEQELSLAEKVDNLRPLVEQGSVLLVYDEATSSVNLMSKEAFEKQSPAD